MRSMLIVSMCALASTTACSPAPREPRAHSKPTLLLEQSAAQPGTQTKIGIQFETDKDWHIYWKNPGDSGEPPEIRWQLPAGVTMGPLQWPFPMRLKTSAGTDYGYEGTVVLLSTLNIPATVRPGSNLMVAGDLRWLVCNDICIPQRAALKANLRISNAATVDELAHALLTANTRIPKPLPESFHLTATSSHDNLQLSFALGNKVSGKIAYAVFFPAEPEQIDNAAPQELATSDGIARLKLKKSDHLQRDPDRLNGVLVLDEQDSYQVDVPIRSPAAHEERKH
jgi:DsbC/DsbD-like thiol-disulfide interchange protein